MLAAMAIVQPENPSPDAMDTRPRTVIRFCCDRSCRDDGQPSGPDAFVGGAYGSSVGRFVADVENTMTYSILSCEQMRNDVVMMVLFHLG